MANTSSSLSFSPLPGPSAELACQAIKSLLAAEQWSKKWRIYGFIPFQASEKTRDPRHFAQVFRRTVGIAPTQFRKAL
jgi:hypothetical protein